MKFAATLGLAFAALTSATPYSPHRIVFQPGEEKPSEAKPWEIKPWADTATVKLANDWSGKHGEAKVTLDRKFYSIESLYGDSDLLASEISMRQVRSSRSSANVPAALFLQMIRRSTSN